MAQAQQIMLRLDEQELAKVDDHARTHEISRSAAAKEIFLAGLNGDINGSTPTENSVKMDEIPDHGEVTFQFTDDLKWFIKGGRYKGYIAGDTLAVINMGGSYHVFKMDDIPAEVVR